MFLRDKGKKCLLWKSWKWKNKKAGFFQIFNILFDFNFVGRFRLCGVK